MNTPAPVPFPLPSGVTPPGFNFRTRSITVWMPSEPFNSQDKVRHTWRWYFPGFRLW